MRLSILALSMAGIMLLSMPGCGSKKTHEFEPNESVPAMASSTVIGADEPSTIDNTGKFTYAFSTSKYNMAIDGAKQTSNVCAGYTVYTDKSGRDFIISGDDKIELEGGKRIPESFRGDLRIEKTGGKLYVYKTEEDAEEARNARMAAKNAQAGVTTDEQVITVNGSKLYLNGAKIIKASQDVFIPCDTVLRMIGDGSHTEIAGDVVTFYIYNYSESKIGAPVYEEFVVDMNQPDTIWNSDKSEYLQTDSDIIQMNDKTSTLYFNPANLGPVFDWQVNFSVPFKDKTGCLDIITDPSMDLQGDAAAILVSEDLSIPSSSAQTNNTPSQSPSNSPTTTPDTSQIESELEAELESIIESTNPADITDTPVQIEGETQQENSASSVPSGGQTQTPSGNQGNAGQTQTLSGTQGTPSQDTEVKQPDKQTQQNGAANNQVQSNQGNTSTSGGARLTGPDDPRFDPNYVNPRTGVMLDYDGNGIPDPIDLMKPSKVETVDGSKYGFVKPK